MHSSSRMVALALSVKDWSQKLGELGERGGLWSEDRDTGAFGTVS